MSGYGSRPAGARRSGEAAHAAFAVVVDLGRLVDYHNSERSRAIVRRIMKVTMLGRPAYIDDPVKES